MDTSECNIFTKKINDCNSNEEPLYFYKDKFYYAGCIRQKLFEENEVLFKILGFYHIKLSDWLTRNKR